MMFQGLTWFGMPLEYFLRISEIFVIGIVGLIVGVVIGIVQELRKGR